MASMREISSGNVVCIRNLCRKCKLRRALRAQLAFGAHVKESSMNFLVIHERGNWSAIRQAKTIEEAKKELLKMVQEATVEWGDVFRISKGPKSRAAAKHLQEHGYSTDHPEDCSSARTA
jgi:hypothetical protein